MPTYLNSTSTVAVVGLTRIEPGQTITTGEWLINLPTGVTRTSVTPYFEPNIYSVALTTPTTVSVPETTPDQITGLPITLVGNYKIRVYVASGSCTVQVNNASAVARYVGLYDTFEIYCRDRIVDNIIVTPASGTVYVSIEKI